MTSVELFFEEENPRRNSLAILRMNLRNANKSLELEDQEFIRNFRLSKFAFQDLFSKIGNKLSVGKSIRFIPLLIKLVIALTFFAEGSYQLGVGNEFNLGLAQFTVSVIFKEIFSALENHI